MTEGRPFEEPIRRVMDANLAYYRSLGRLSKEYWGAVFSVWRELARSVMPGSGFSREVSSTEKVAGISSRQRDPTLVLEAESNQDAQGVFLVENRLSRAVSAPVLTSAFTSRSGQAIQPTLRIVPGTVTLQPGDRSLVQIIAVITDELEPGIDYRGEVYVPDLSDQGIPVLLRRREGSGTGPAAASKPKKTRTSRRRRSTGP